MFRTIGRIACIVLVAGAVGGMLFLLADRSGGSTETGPRADGGRRRHNGWPGRVERMVDGERGGRGRVPRMGYGEGDGHGQFSLGRGIGGVGVTLLQVGLVAGVVAGLQKRLHRQR
jgi:hypothetical protein